MAVFTCAAQSPTSTPPPSSVLPRSMDRSSASIPRGVGYSPSSWQALVSRQRASVARGGHGRRRQTRDVAISGIPEFDDFVAEHEEREREREIEDAVKADEDLMVRDEIGPPSPGYVFEMSDLGERLRKDPSDDSIAHAHHRPRHPRRNSNIPDTAESGNELQVPLPDGEDEYIINARRHDEWRERCIRALRDKQNLQVIPPPPLGPCQLCQDYELAPSHPSVLTCIHSMDVIYRSTLVVARRFAHPDYYLLLKQQRTVWHPDRFSTCDNERYPRIAQDASTLFRIATDLMEHEKKWLQDVGFDLPTSRANETNTTPVPDAAAAAAASAAPRPRHIHIPDRY